MTVMLKPYPSIKHSGVEWLGEVPAHWDVRRLKQICRMKYGNSLVTDSRCDGSVPVFGSNGCVGFHDKANTHAPCVIVGRKGSFGKVHHSETPAFAIDTTFFVDSRSSSAHIRWLYYLLGWLCLDEVTKDSAVPGLDREEAYQRLGPLPPFPEQAAIVRFLDHADQRIQRYIRAKEKLIALLEEQKQAIVHQAVTGRIDVRTGQPYPTYKPSGVEWLREVPSHWDIRRAKHVFGPRNEYARPSDVQLSATQAFGVIAQAKYEKKIGRKVTKISRHLDRRRHVEVNDFVISMRSFQGGLERAWEAGCIRSSYIVLRPATRLNVGYFAYLFKSAAYIAALQMSANFIRDGQDLNYNDFCGVDLPFPPRTEQQEIADVLDRRIEDTNLKVKQSRREIELVHEFRTRLIADAITGKLDVREAAATLPEVDSLAEDDEADATLDAGAEPTFDDSNEPAEVTR